MIHDLAATLECKPADLTPETNLIDAGLDSLRMIMLVETWRAEGFSVELHDLFALTTVGQWQEYFAAPKA